MHTVELKGANGPLFLDPRTVVGVESCNTPGLCSILTTIETGHHALIVEGSATEVHATLLKAAQAMESNERTARELLDLHSEFVKVALGSLVAADPRASPNVLAQAALDIATATIAILPR